MAMQPFDVSQVVSQLRAALQDRSTSAQAKIDRAEAILRSIDAATASSTPVLRARLTRPAARGGLAPWQSRRVHDYIEDRLAGGISCDELAGMVGLSSHHFSRAFRVSFNESPHAYLIKARVRRSCALMLASAGSLGQIAADCGFNDQAHFNRVFRKHCGASPGDWRRQQRAPLLSTKIQSRGDSPNVLSTESPTSSA
jgi:AraC family transcriptional regulator